MCHYTRTLMSVCIAAWIDPLLSQVEDARLFVWLPVSMVPSDNFDGDLSLNVGHESFRDVSQSSNYQHKGYLLYVYLSRHIMSELGQLQFVFRSNTLRW